MGAAEETIRVLLNDREMLEKKRDAIQQTIDRITRAIEDMKRRGERVPGRYTSNGRYIRTLEETRNMNFPYPPEEGL